jgi:NAD(P)-dependent dehydrogenase (short-subunit alcohol dehydrogenase family)
VPGRLDGKVCIITGTGGGMGRGTALTFAREGALVVGCDVAVEPAEQTVELAMSEFGRIDVLFNLAGRSHFAWLENVTDQDWDAARRDEVDLVFYLTRAAIIGMTRQLALEGGEHGIRVNSISPGLIVSNATRGELEDEKWASGMRDRTLLGRLGEPEDVANVALFLACAESSYVTGVDIVVDGGMKVW